VDGLKDLGAPLSKSDEVLARDNGHEEASRIIKDAQAATVKLGPKLDKFLNSTGLGNDPSVLYALAAWKRGDLKVSPAKAQAELEKMTRDPKGAYRNVNDPNHKSAVARANILYAITAKAEAKAEARKAAEPSKPRAKSANESRNADLDAQIKAINADPDIRRRDSPRYKELAAKARALYEQRYGTEAHEA
jgi:hypothetical protein